MANEAGHNPSVYQNLIDAGCGPELVARYFELQTQGRDCEQRCLLSAHRRRLLEKLHEAQKCLDCLDYLLYQMRKDSERTKGEQIR